ncbi:MAG: hypothetical protein PF448_09105 [Bacteroidales bacterium]|jgi:hypothetical protein|nr:hypothetical protein [Bacteroidales bacterium]
MVKIINITLICDVFFIKQFGKTFVFLKCYFKKQINNYATIFLKVLIVFLFFGFANFNFAQSDNHDEKEILSLDKALSLSMEMNPELNRLNAETEQVKNAWKSQSGLANPELIYYQN